MHSTDPALPAPRASHRPPAARAPSPFSAAARLRRGIECAHSWEELDHVAQATDVAYRQGEVDLLVVQELTALIVRAARFLDREDPQDRSVWAHDLVDPALAASCSCCGQQLWWQKGGEAVCGTCHPQPNWVEEEALATRTAA